MHLALHTHGGMLAPTIHTPGGILEFRVTITDNVIFLVDTEAEQSLAEQQRSA